MILRWTKINRWLHSPCYWNVWVFSFSFWFIPSCLCTYHYYASLVFFFNPCDVHFSLSTTYVHSLVACASHSDSSASYYTWSRLFSLPHIVASAPLSLVDLWQMTTFVFFVIIDHHFVASGHICIGLGFFFFRWLLAFFYFLWVVSTRALICLVLLLDGFSSLIFLHFFLFSLPLASSLFTSSSAAAFAHLWL
jgi:hypothetical protein